MSQRLDPRCGDGVDVSLDPAAAVVTLTVFGRWRRRLRREVHDAVGKSLAEHPPTLLIDTRHLYDPGAESISTWLSVHRNAVALQPPVHVLLHVPPDTHLATRLHRLGITRSVHVFADLDEARTAAVRRLPISGRVDLTLMPDDTAPARARTVMTEACTAWRLPDIRDRARLVVSELVANAVQHAGTPISVIVSRRGTGVHTGVHTVVGDGNPQLPVLGPVRRAASGLRVVQAAATRWGAMPSGAGKVVWATIEPP